LHSAHGDDTKEVFTKKLIRKEIGFWHQDFQNSQKWCFTCGCNLRKSYVPSKNSSPSIHIYIYFFFQNYEFQECTVPWPNRMLVLQMLIWKSFLLVKLLCLAFQWQTYKYLFKNLPII
jgi:hypothetical protein